MAKCKAFYPIAGSRTAWIPCVRKAEEGTGFCRRHGDAVVGAWLGVVVREKPVDEVVHMKKEKWLRGRRISATGDQRSGGKRK